MKKTLLFLLALFLIVSCDALKIKDRGKEGEACFTDNTCKEPYECIDGKCVKKTAHDDDDTGETDDELVVGDDEGGEDDQSDQSDSSDVSDEPVGDDAVVVTDEDAADDLSDAADVTPTDDTVVEPDDTVILPDDVVTDDPVGDDVVVVADEDAADDQPDTTDTADVTPSDDTVIVTDDATVTDDDVTDVTPSDDTVVVTDDAADVTPTDDAVIVTDDAVVSDDDVVATMDVLCTGQTKCYNATVEVTCPTEGNAFYGQDAQYAALGYCTPRDYAVSGTGGNDIVTDNVTGLIWQRTLPATYMGCIGGDPMGATCEWQHAIDYCSNLTYGTYDDWRLPNRKELATLPDYGRFNPAIDTTTFPGTKSSFYWSSSPYVGDSTYAWGVYFDNGYVGYSLKTNTGDVRCVRGDALPDSAFTESTVSGKVLVTDTVTGLVWTKEYSGTVTWQSALNYCETLDYGGATDWRLPNVGESETLIDDATYDPASSFPGMPAANFFWSSSSFVSDTTYAWRVSFGNGGYIGSSSKVTTTYWARCVRSEPVAPVNECVTQSNPCDDGGDGDAACTDEAVGYTCNCSLNYTDDGTTCAPDTRTFTCNAKPDNTEWNTVGSYQQTWTGAAWDPADSATFYNETASTTACFFKCAADYYWDGEICTNTRVEACTGIIANAIYYGGETTYLITQYYNEADGWGPDTDAYHADDIPDQGTCEYQCNINYQWDGDSCEPGTRTFTCAAKPDYSQWNTVSSYQQTWIDGSTWDPADSTTTHDPTPSTDSCRFVCLTNYTWNGTDCAPDTRTYTCQDKPFRGTEWNTVDSYQQTWDGSAWSPVDDPTTDYSATADTASCRYKCEAGYYWNGSYCVNNKVVCTGQTLCYDNSTTMTCPSWNAAFTGQDAQYLVQCEPRDYTVSGGANNDVVTDSNTGLIWQRTLPATYPGCTGGAPSGSTCTWQQAIDYCGNLSYGGQDDWRLPSRKELATLPDYGRSGPAIDTSIFPGTQSDYYWSSSSYTGDLAQAWDVFGGNGGVNAHSKTATGSYVRCVRGVSLSDSTFTEATVSGKIIVTDAATGLQWTKDYGSSKNWQDALNYCETLDYGGATDWRLPNVTEMQTLVNNAIYDPGSSFPGVLSERYWSSSTLWEDTSKAWYIRLLNGVVLNGTKASSYYYALCVRSPVDECMKWSNPCNDNGDAAGTCTDTPTGYTCDCTDYYFDFFNGSCRDIDECMSIQFCNDNGDTSATCTNISPGYDCGCSEGFEISYTAPATPEYPTCVDIPPPTGVLCTGQTLCYDETTTMTCPTEGNAFYGQDAQYALLGECVPRDYTVSGDTGDDIITDNVTGLIWQRTLPATYAGCTGVSGTKCAWQEAIDYCGNLIYAGQDDWWLPTDRELVSIVDYGRYNPPVDTAIFLGTSTEYFWTSSSRFYYTEYAWAVKFDDNGILHYENKTNPHPVRCVRGAGGVPESTFTEETVEGKVIVTDTVRNLMWTKEYAASVTWQTALDHCEDLSYGGYEDWRLPNIEEMKPLLDRGQYNPASNFPNMPVATFWSSSSHAYYKNTAWYGAFDYGSVSYSAKTYGAYNARCVR